MAEQLNLNINVTGNVNESLGSIKKQLREAQNEVTALSDKFGATSQEAIQAAKRAAELKDRIGDAKALTDAFNPDAKFKALSASLSGVAGGFAAVQGAIGLFGSESKELEKQLLKVQSALALSQGLQSIGESVDSFKQLGAVVKNQVVTAFSTLKGAIIATGIGALAIAIGLVAANFDKVKKVVLDLIPGLGSVADFIGNLVNKVTDFVGITSEAGRATAKLIEDNDKAIKNSERFLELNGDKYDEYTQRKLKANNDFKKQQNEFLKDEKITEDERNFYIKQAREKANREILKADQDRYAKAAEINKKAEEKAKEDADKVKKDREDRAKQEYDDFVKNVTDLSDQTNAAVDLLSFIIEEQKKKEQELFDWRVDIAQRSFDTSQQTYDYYKELQKKQQEDEQKIIDARLTAQLDYYSQIGAGLGQLSELFGKGTAASKAAALAEIAIQTGVGFAQGLDIAQKSAKGTGPAAAFAFPIFYATQVAAVLATINKAKGILSTVKGGGGGISASAPSIASGTPFKPEMAQIATTNISQASINALGNQAVKAYVVESDLTTSQQRIKAIQQRARFE